MTITADLQERAATLSRRLPLSLPKEIASRDMKKIGEALFFPGLIEVQLCG